ncbi:MAG: hypothetical protein ACNS60_07350 [Candidatus Cyclobacteriaceae bacterium M2_1C_046]
MDENITIRLLKKSSFLSLWNREPYAINADEVKNKPKPQPATRHSIHPKNKYYYKVVL